MVQLDGYQMTIEHISWNKNQNAENLGKETEFNVRLEKKNKLTRHKKSGCSFKDKDTYGELPLPSWLDR